MSPSDLPSLDAQMQKEPNMDEQYAFRRRHETAALNVVSAIKRDFMPNMDSNDGGEMLSWLLDLLWQTRQIDAVGAEHPQQEQAFQFSTETVEGYAQPGNVPVTGTVGTITEQFQFGAERVPSPQPPAADYLTQRVLNPIITEIYRANVPTGVAEQLENFICEQAIVLKQELEAGVPSQPPESDKWPKGTVRQDTTGSMKLDRFLDSVKRLERVSKGETPEKLEAAGVPSPPPRSEGFDLAVERVAAGICHARAGQGQTCRDKYGVGSWCSACLGHFLLEHVPVAAPSSPSAGWQNKK